MRYSGGKVTKNREILLFFGRTVVTSTAAAVALSHFGKEYEIDLGASASDPQE